MNSFNNFNLDTEILKSLDILDYKIPSQVQSRVIPVLIDKKDILVKSKTGTGKSAAFAIPICNKIKKLENKFNTQRYSDFTKTSTSIQIVKNNENIENINVSKYQFENDNIKIYKYEK